MREAVPAATRLIIALNANQASDAQEISGAAMSAARKFGFVPEIALLTKAADIQLALRSGGASAMILYGLSQPSSPIKAGEVIALALQGGVPTFVDAVETLAVGGLMCYECDWDNQLQRTAAQLDKVLRGVNPAEIPFELPTRYWLAVNLKTARALGLVLPQVLLARADQLIE